MNHPELVAALTKPPSAIRDGITEQDCALLHATLGIPGEAGEIVDAIKKHVIYKKPLNRLNLVEELGDIEFYLENLRQIVGITREETITENIRKLQQRYSKLSYSDEQAQARADKQ